MLKRAVRKLAARFGYDVRKIADLLPQAFAHIPDAHLYRPYYSPWLGEPNFSQFYAVAEPRTLVSPDRCFVLYRLLLQAVRIDGDIWECGVYRGGTAAMFAKILAEYSPSKKLYLFDTFAGMPETDSVRDIHKAGDFSDTSATEVARYVGHPDITVMRPGFIPDTFAGLEDHRIAFAHIDVDIYRPILDGLAFIWPRLTRGGFIIFDDYGFPSCPGARQAVDEFFLDKACVALCLPTGQAIVFNGVNG